MAGMKKPYDIMELVYKNAKKNRDKLFSGKSGYQILKEAGKLIEKKAKGRG